MGTVLLDAGEVGDNPQGQMRMWWAKACLWDGIHPGCTQNVTVIGHGAIRGQNEPLKPGDDVATLMPTLSAAEPDSN